jgi:hypothetical protein
MSQLRLQTRIVIACAGGLRAAAMRKLYRHCSNLNREDKKCVPKAARSHDFSSFFALILLREVIQKHLGKHHRTIITTHKTRRKTYVKASTY